MFWSEIDIIPGSGLLAMSHKILLSLVQACEKIEIKGKVETLVQSRGQGKSVSGFFYGYCLTVGVGGANLTGRAIEHSIFICCRGEPHATKLLCK